ncbi:MAG TPA: chorismate synthase [Candidatus Limiplasma sp.]|nr:chorismate synthase [Candidatus Limiplasma sp.]
MNTYGQNLKITIFGQSHAPAIGVILDGFPAGITIDMQGIGRFMKRRASNGAAYATKRREPDIPEFLSGLVNDTTCGAPIAAIIRNTDTRSVDYEAMRDVPRPSHADYTAYVQSGGHNDIAGGGQFSGRLTAPLCIAGAMCLQLLERYGIHIAAHILSIGSITDTPFDPVTVDCKVVSEAMADTPPVLNQSAWHGMLREINDARQGGDSVGGVIECAVSGLPAGIGNPMFDGMENRIAAAVFGIPAVKGISFGSGFAGARKRGSQNNDAFVMDNGSIRTQTNNHGGILGGITSGMPLVFQAAVKPTPSIAMEQDSVSLSQHKNVKLQIQGRHDPCIVPRAVPCMEAAAAIAVCDALLEPKQMIGEL